MTDLSADRLRQGGSPPEDEELEDWEAEQEAAKLLLTLKREITPSRVAMAGAVLFMIITMTVSGWYWLLPRDAVTVDTHYMQRGGHLMMSELHNDGSRAITDVKLEVEFQSVNFLLINFFLLTLKEVLLHKTIMFIASFSNNY